MSVLGRLVAPARTSVKAAAAGLDALHRPTGGITILIYHRVGAGAGGQMDLAPASFDEQLRWLVDNHAVITLDDALDRLGAGNGNDDRCRAGRAGRRAIVLTFDDGTTDWVDNVLPALEQHRAPATFYVATSFVEDQVAMPGGGRPISWAGLRELAGSELTTIGSHTHRHMLLDRLDRHTVAEELDRSVDLLGEHLGVHAEHFAYPKAVAGSPTAEAAVRQRFRSAVLAGTRPNPVGTDPHRLHRSPIQAADTTTWFRRKALGGMHGEDDLRRIANRVRYRRLDS